MLMIQFRRSDFVTACPTFRKWETESLLTTWKRVYFKRAESESFYKASPFQLVPSLFTGQAVCSVSTLGETVNSRQPVWAYSLGWWPSQVFPRRLQCHNTWLFEPHTGTSSCSKMHKKTRSCVPFDTQDLMCASFFRATWRCHGRKNYSKMFWFLWYGICGCPNCSRISFHCSKVPSV